jgi:PKD repeat protein
MKSVVLFLMIAVAASVASAATPPTPPPESDGWDYFPLPAKTPRTEVPCLGDIKGDANTTPVVTVSKCTGAYRNALTVGYDGALSGYLGRVLDSTNVGDHQGVMRTLRGWQLRYDKSRKRLYWRMGSTLAIYDVPHMLTRLATGQDRRIAGVSNRPATATKGEAFLDWDRYFYAETSGWSCPAIDGQDRMPSFDIDDRGYIYMAYTIFGWGITKDDFGKSGSGQLERGPVNDIGKVLWQIGPPPAGDPTPAGILTLKSLNGQRYFALVSSGGAGPEVWDVTNQDAPIKVGTSPRDINAAAKSDDAKWVALADVSAGGQFYIYSSDALTSGGAPAYTGSATVGAFWGVTTDGVNFYSSQVLRGQLIVSIFAPNGLGGFLRTDVPTGVNMPAPGSVHFNEGYLTVLGSNDLEVFRVGGTSLTRLDLNAYVAPGPGKPVLGTANRYFNRYYVKCGSPPCSDSVPAGYVPPDIINFIDAMVFRDGTKTYLVVSLRNMIDVYEIRGTDGVTLLSKGVAGTNNPNSKQAPGTGPYYGDRVTFGSTTTAPAAMNVTWNFGNAESVSDNSASSTTGLDVSHQYSGLTIGQLPASRTVTVTNTTDSSIADSNTVILAAPVARVGVKNTTTLFQNGATSTAPIVTSDTLVDASDGTVEGHYTSWTIDGTTTRAIPSATMPVGTCGAHTLSFAANYGPYTGAGSTLASTNGAVTLSIAGANYTVVPFAAAVAAPTSDATNITFASASRATTDTAVLAANAALTYKWDLLNSSNTSVLTTSGTATIGQIPPFQVPRTSFTGLTGAKVRLQLSIAAAGLPTACQPYASSTALTGQLSAPDPKIVGPSAACYAGTPCGPMSASSASSADMSGWTLAWAVAPATVVGGSGTTYSPNFPSAFAGTVTLTATNAVGTGSDSKSLSVAAPLCNALPTAGDLALNYGGTTANCYLNGTCTPNETITFGVNSFNRYLFNANCDQYVWTFGDGVTASTFSAKHAYTTAGTFNGNFRLTVNGQSLTIPFSVVISSGGGGNNGGGGGGGNQGCAVLQDTSVFIHFVGDQSTCSDNTPATACKSGESLAISANANSFTGYNFSCGTHSFAWSFGDGQNGTGQTINHTYAVAGTYPLSLTVTGPNGVAHTAVNIVVTGGSTGGGGACTLAPTALTTFISFTAPSGCTINNASCKTSENISFGVSALSGYNLNCPHTFTWDFGDGHDPGNGQSVSHSYSTAGTYPVKVTINNSVGSVILSQNVTITTSPGGGGGNCQIPTTDLIFLTYSAPSGCSYTVGTPCTKGETVSFGASANTFKGYNFTCGTHTFAWSFGDGGTSTLQSPTHVFLPSATPQTYNVTCTINNGSGTLTIPIAVQVGATTTVEMEANFTYEAVSGVPTLIKFTPTVSKGTPTHWVWNWGDGQPAATLDSSTLVPQFHQYAVPGTYHVTMTYGDSANPTRGQKGQDVLVGVNPPPPRPRPGRH